MAANENSICFALDLLKLKTISVDCQKRTLEKGDLCCLWTFALGDDDKPGTICSRYKKTKTATMTLII